MVVSWVKYVVHYHLGTADHFEHFCPIMKTFLMIQILNSLTFIRFVIPVVLNKLIRVELIIQSNTTSCT